MGAKVSFLVAHKNHGTSSLKGLDKRRIRLSNLGDPHNPKALLPKRLWVSEPLVGPMEKDDHVHLLVCPT